MVAKYIPQVIPLVGTDPVDVDYNTGFALTGTAIDGRRPHLTVMEGHGNVVVSALIPALLPLLPAAVRGL